MNPGRTNPSARRVAFMPAIVALAWAGLCGVPAAQAQVAGSLEALSQVRFRGIGTTDKGPGLRASLLADSPWAATEGAYGGLSVIARTANGSVGSLYEMLGWSRRFNAWQAFDEADPAWAWDLTLMHVKFFSGPRSDFSQVMASLHAPGWTMRISYAPHYFFGSAPNYYLTLDHNIPLDMDWRVVLHAGRSAYAASRDGQPRPTTTVDALAGIVYNHGDWDVELSVDGLTAGHAPVFVTDAARRPAAVVSVQAAF